MAGEDQQRWQQRQQQQLGLHGNTGTSAEAAGTSVQEQQQRRLILLHAQIRIEMKKYFMQYLDTHGPGMEAYVCTSVVQLLCRTVKLAWFDADAPRGIVDECKALMERGSPGHYLLALKVLTMLVSEINTATPGRTLTAHRKIAVSFRDLSLLSVFKVALVALRQLLDNRAEPRLKEQGLTLALACLSFDFVGTCLDDSAEDMSTIQVPSSWRGLIEDPSTLQLFLDYYAASGPPPSKLALECLVRLASVRRSLFSSDVERSKFLNRLVNGCRDILRAQSGLAEHHDNYHEFCRLLGRLKTNYQLSELVSVDNYTEWIQLVAQLTIDSLNSWQWAKDSVYYLLGLWSSLNSWQWAKDSVYYLLGLWSRLVSSMPYLKGDSPSLLEANVPKITQAYITSRLESVRLVLVGGSSLDDMLDAEDQLSEQLESLPYLVRFQYDKSSQFVCSLIDPLVVNYKQATTMTGLDAAAKQQLAVLEGQLAWMVSIVGSVIRGRLSSSSSSAESQESIDGDLAARVFGLLSLMDTGVHQGRYQENSRQRLDMAVLGFFQNFRKVYIGEQVMQSSTVYSKLGERLGLADHQAVLTLMLLLLLLLLPGDAEQQRVMQSSNVYSKLGERLGLADHQAVLTLMLLLLLLLLQVMQSSTVYSKLRERLGLADHQAVLTLMLLLLLLLQVMQSSNVYSKLGERLGLADHQAVLTLMLLLLLLLPGDAEQQRVMQSSNVYSKLGERLGLADHQAVLTLMLQKIATNLKVYGSSEGLVHLTLTLFQDLATGYMSGKLLLKLEAVHFMLGHHTSAYYSFLDAPPNSRNRTCYYNTLARLLFMEDAPSRFKGFMAPLQSAFGEIAARSSNCSSPAQLRQSAPQLAVVGLFRDLRGIAAATATRRTYSLLFDWMYPAHFRAVLCCLEAFADTPAVTTPLLKFVSEFVFNKSQRLTFDSSSPNGILLFREVSKVLVCYGQHVLNVQQVSDPYNDKYKGIWICLQALSRAMSGNYVNFGVFELYGDAALSDALGVALRMALSIPLADIMSYKKVAKAYFSLIEVLCHNHTGTVACQDSVTFGFILSSLDQGLKSLDVSISSACASAVDNLASFYFRNVVREPESGRPAPGSAEMQEHLRQQPALLPEILRSLFEIILFEENSNQWSLSRPMLSLILINEAVYLQLRQQIIVAQPPDKQPHLAACLDKLMTDVGSNLEPKNRDKFTQNLTIVRHEYRSKT
uniref:Exportin-7/Ran-binding protein 17 TPR repeats domain-containing protein n=1 Tax=Tetradesmus obliquus TaxID=3088 RepID=A0A383V5G5_TETOB